MFLLEPLLSRSLESNIINVVQILVKRLGIKISLTSIREKLTEHPDYPSLLSISDSLASWKIPSLAFKAEKETLLSLPTPFMVQIKEGNEIFFSVVSFVDTNKLVISDSITSKSHEMAWDAFMSKWTKIVMAVEATEASGDEKYTTNHKYEMIQRLSYTGGLILLFVVVACVAFFHIQSLGWSAWKGIALLFTKLFGVYIGGLLLWYEVDKNNMAIQKVCKAGKNKNCNAVLQSPLAKLFGLISWSEIGFVYFTGGLLFLLFTSLSSGALSLIYLLSILAFPYVIFSLFYQWRVVKQWCLLCITVQMVLIAEFVVSFIEHSYSFDVLSSVSPIQFFQLFFFFIGVLILWLLIKPLLNASKETLKYKVEFTKIKHNPQLFEGLLSKQRKIQNENELLGFSLGNPDSAHKLVKVCNPYCGPCASMHPDIHHLLEVMPNLQLQIIFTATSKEADSRSFPVKHFYAILEEYGVEVLDKALNDWYTSKEKDYHDFANKYPVKGKLEKFDGRLDEMAAWCHLNDISYTPTIFINGYELPGMYEVADLQYLLK
jgi:uncharacterized membrane protein